MTDQHLSDFARQVGRAIAIRHSGIAVAKVNAAAAAALVARGFIARHDKHGVAVAPPLQPGREDVWRITPAGAAEFGKGTF